LNSLTKNHILPALKKVQ